MVIDIIFVIVLLYGFYLGFAKGIIQTVFTVLSVAFGLMAAFKFAQPMSVFLESLVGTNNPLMFIAGFLLAFVGTMMFIRLIARGLEGILESVNINIINQILGGMLLAAVMVLVLSMLLWFSDQARMIDAKTKKESFTYPYLEQYPAQVRLMGEQLKPTFEDFWNQSLDMLDRLQEMSIEQTEESDVYDIEEEK